MFRRPRAKAPDEDISKLGDILAPVPVFPWYNVATCHLGVPVVVPQYFIAVQDDHYAECIQKLVDAGFSISVPKRGLNPALSTTMTNFSEANARIQSGYAFRDKSTTTLTHPDYQVPVVIAPNSFTCLPIPLSDSSTSLGGEYDVHGNLHFPLEKALVESFVRCMLLEKSPTYSRWARALQGAISQMVGYLDVNNDILDTCEDHEAVEWYSKNFGRDHEAQNGPWDLRISKRIGSGREPQFDSRGRPLNTVEGDSLTDDKKTLRQ